MPKDSSPMKSLSERYLLIDTDILRVPEAPGVLVLYGAKSDPICVTSVPNVRSALIKAKGQYQNAVEFALVGLDYPDKKSRAQLARVLQTAFSLREKRDKEIVTCQDL